MEKPETKGLVGSRRKPTRVRLIPKSEDFFKISIEIEKIFKKKKWRNAARRKGLEPSNIYRQIKSCNGALWKIRKVLWIVDCDLKWEIVEKPKEPIDQK